MGRKPQYAERHDERLLLQRQHDERHHWKHEERQHEERREDRPLGRPPHRQHAERPMERHAPYAERSDERQIDRQRQYADRSDDRPMDRQPSYVDRPPDDRSKERQPQYRDASPHDRPKERQPDDRPVRHPPPEDRHLPHERQENERVRYAERDRGYDAGRSPPAAHCAPRSATPPPFVVQGYQQPPQGREDVSRHPPRVIAIAPDAPDASPHPPRVVPSMVLEEPDRQSRSSAAERCGAGPDARVQVVYVERQAQAQDTPSTPVRPNLVQADASVLYPCEAHMERPPAQQNAQLVFAERHAMYSEMYGQHASPDAYRVHDQAPHLVASVESRGPPLQAQAQPVEAQPVQAMRVSTLVAAQAQQYYQRAPSQDTLPSVTHATHAQPVQPMQQAMPQNYFRRVTSQDSMNTSVGSDGYQPPDKHPPMQQAQAAPPVQYAPVEAYPPVQYVPSEAPVEAYAPRPAVAHAAPQHDTQVERPSPHPPPVQQVQAQPVQHILAESPAQAQPVQVVQAGTQTPPAALRIPPDPQQPALAPSFQAERQTAVQAPMELQPPPAQARVDVPAAPAIQGGPETPPALLRVPAEPVLAPTERQVPPVQPHPAPLVHVPENQPAPVVQAVQAEPASPPQLPLQAHVSQVPGEVAPSALSPVRDALPPVETPVPPAVLPADWIEQRIRAESCVPPLVTSSRMNGLPPLSLGTPAPASSAETNLGSAPVRSPRPAQRRCDGGASGPCSECPPAEPALAAARAPEQPHGEGREPPQMDGGEAPSSVPVKHVYVDSHPLQVDGKVAAAALAVGASAGDQQRTDDSTDRSIP